MGDRLSMSKFFISVWEIDLVCRNPSLSPFEMVFYLCANGHVTLSFWPLKCNQGVIVWRVSLIEIVLKDIEKSNGHIQKYVSYFGKLVSVTKSRVEIPIGLVFIALYRSWWGVLDTILCDKVRQWLTCDRSVVFSGYSSFPHQ